MEKISIKDYILTNKDKLDLLENSRDFLLKNSESIQGILHFASQEIVDDENFVNEILQNDLTSIKYVSKRLLNSFGFVFNWYSKYGSRIWEFETENEMLSQYIGEDLLNNKEIAKILLKYNYANFNVLGNNLKNDESVLFELIKVNKGVLKIVDTNSFNENFRHKLINDSIKNLYFFEKEKNEKKWALIAAKNGMLEVVSSEMQDDKDVVEIAVKENVVSIYYASDRLKKDKSLAKLVISKEPIMFASFSQNLREDFELIEMAIIEMVRKNSGGFGILDFVSESVMKKDESLIKLLELCEKHGASNYLIKQPPLTNVLKNKSIEKIFDKLYPKSSYLVEEEKNPLLGLELIMLLRKKDMEKDIVKSQNKTKKLKF